jgi:hypothetical protein
LEAGNQHPPLQYFPERVRNRRGYMAAMRFASTGAKALTVGAALASDRHHSVKFFEKHLTARLHQKVSRRSP